jgi:hypothetical protein
MASAALPAPENEPLFVNPWPWLAGGLAATGLAAAAALAFSLGGPVRLVLVFGGVLAAAAGVVVRPGSARVLAAAAAAAFLASWGLYSRDNPAAWDSIRMVLTVTAAVALAAALLMLLPRVWRRVAVSVLIVFHFGGILSAVFSATPGMWLANVAYVYVYRNYLEFMYLINAYHFYAPEPGPAYLLWFRIEYTKDPDRGITYWHWHKVPDLDDDGWPKYPMDLQYQRRIALAGLAAQATVTPDPQRSAAIQYRHGQENLARYRAGRLIIPRHPNVQAVQYAEPTRINSLVVSSYVRHVAFKFQEAHPEAHIRNIKVYRIIHLFQGAIDFAADKDPCDLTTYLPYFWGKYDARGKLLDPNDPFLYWQLPFLKVNPGQRPHFRPNSEVTPQLPPAERPRFHTDFEDQFWLDVANATRLDDEEDFKVFGYMYLHAGDSKWVLHSGERTWKEE